MKKIWLVFFCLLLLFNCENSKTKSQKPLSLIPENTEIIIKINSSESLENGLKNNSLIKAIKGYSQINEFETLISPIYQINKDYCLIAVSRNQKDSLEISYILPITKKVTTLDSIQGLKADSSFQNKVGIKKWLYNDKPLYSKVNKNLLFISSSVEIVEKTLNTDGKIDPDIEAIFKTSNKEKTVSIVINHRKDPNGFKILSDSTFNSYKFSNYSLIDCDISQNSILINGVTMASDSTKSLINVFKNLIPQENKITEVLPANTKNFTSITFNNYKTFRENLIKHGIQDSILDNSKIFENIVEAGYAKQEGSDAFILRSIDPSSTLENLNPTVSSDTYREIELHPLDDANSFINDFSPFVSIKSADHYINLDDFFVFSNDIEFLKSIISNYQSKNILAESKSYKDLKINLSDEASLLIYGNSSELNTLLNSNFTDDKKLDISNYKSSAIQFVYETDFAHIAAAFKTHKNKSDNNSVTEEFNISIGANLLMIPQLVKNHTNNQMNIVVQDINNNLYLISNQGKVYWKKQIEGGILGRIEQIDTYKNGRLQLVFNTSNRLYILDRNGKDVNNFPLKFQDNITQPVSVYDYDNNKNYRLLITQGKSVLMYDKNGEIVKGFKYKTANSTITSQPKHFRIARKDYIVFSNGNKLEILDRVGDSRIRVKENISFSDNEIYLYNNNFTTSTTNGELIEINQKGNVNHKNLNANTNHKIATTSKTLVILNENKLTIKSNTIDLDFGDYTQPKIYYIKDKIYVTVTDLQSKRGFLFDSQAKPIANFPVYANSELELNNIDKDNALEIVTKGDDDSIIVYEF